MTSEILYRRNLNMYLVSVSHWLVRFCFPCIISLNSSVSDCLFCFPLHLFTIFVSDIVSIAHLVRLLSLPPSLSLSLSNLSFAWTPSFHHQFSLVDTPDALDFPSTSLANFSIQIPFLSLSCQPLCIGPSLSNSWVFSLISFLSSNTDV